MDFYPSEFSPEARDRIEKEKIRVYRELLPSSVYGFNEQALAIRCVMRIFLAFAKEACALRKERGWTIERIERESDEFRRKLTITVLHDKFPDLYRPWISNWNGSVASDVERRFRETPEWKEYEELLLTTPLDATTNAAVASTVDSLPVKAENQAPKSWQEIEIAFLSDHRVEISCGATERKAYNYSDLGFEDRRSGKQNLAWTMLSLLAEKRGTMTEPPPGEKRAMAQKRIQELRRWLQAHFRIDTDPIPCNGGVYQTSFKIGCRPSFNT